jgi:hypothetical protein
VISIELWIRNPDTVPHEYKRVAYLVDCDSRVDADSVVAIRLGSPDAWSEDVGPIQWDGTAPNYVINPGRQGE